MRRLNLLLTNIKRAIFPPSLHSALDSWWYLLAISLVGVLPLVLPILSAEELTGWDTHGHLILTERMAMFLREGRITGYVPEWEAGFPAFTLYPPLFFILTSAPAALLPDLISAASCYHAMVFLLPFLLAIATTGLARLVLPASAWSPLITLLLVYFMLPGLGAYGVGLESLTGVGLVPSFFGLVLFTFFAWSVEHLRAAPSNKAVLTSGILLGSIFLSHTLTSVFALLYLLLLMLCCSQALRLRLCLIVVVGMACSAWWLVPFVQSLPYSSGEAIIDGNSLSPLSVFFPIGPAVGRLVASGKLESALQAFEIAPHLDHSYRSLIGAFMLLSVAGGILSFLRRGLYHLPLLFLSGAALVPGGFLLSAFGLPLHAYRFSSALWIIELLLSAEGVALLFRALPQRFSLLRHLLVVGTGIWLSALAWNNLLVLVQSKSLFAFRAEDRPAFSQGELLLAHLRANLPRGRIAVESELRSFRMFGSPHWLLTEIPRKLGIPTVPGVYAESSLSSPFITPTLAALGSQIVWGAPELARRKSFMRQSYRSMIDRLKMYSVGSIVAVSGRMRKNLRRLASYGVTVQFENADLTLFSLGEPPPIIDTFSKKPVLYVERGGIPFRAFTKWMYASKDLFSVPFVEAPSSDSLPANLKNQISAVIVSCGRQTSLSSAELASWRTLGSVLLVNCPVASLPPEASASGFIRVPYLFRDYHVKPFAQALLPLLTSAPAEWRIEEHRLSAHDVYVSAEGPVLVRMNAARCWNTASRARLLLNTSPSFMAILGDGPVKLTYHC